jgi:hypothetical protein
MPQSAVKTGLYFMSSFFKIGKNDPSLPSFGAAFKPVAIIILSK